MGADELAMAGEGFERYGLLSVVIPVPPMPRLPIPSLRYTFPKGKPILLLMTPVVFVTSFSALAVRWTWVQPDLSDGKLFLWIKLDFVVGDSAEEC